VSGTPFVRLANIEQEAAGSHEAVCFARTNRLTPADYRLQKAHCSLRFAPDLRLRRPASLRLRS